jgi:hypothetical protein
MWSARNAKKPFRNILFLSRLNLSGRFQWKIIICPLRKWKQKKENYFYTFIEFAANFVVFSTFKRSFPSFFYDFHFLAKKCSESVHDDDPEDCNVLCPPRWVDLKHLTVGARLVETGRKFGTALWSFSNLTVWIVKFAQYSWSWHQAEYIKPKI